MECRFKHTILFVAFDFEEDTANSKFPIPSGSEHFVANLTKYLRKSGGTVKGALVLEMIANYNSSRGDLTPCVFLSFLLVHVQHYVRSSSLCLGSQALPPSLSSISRDTYLSVIDGGSRGDFLAVVGRKKNDLELMRLLERRYEKGKN